MRCELVYFHFYGIWVGGGMRDLGYTISRCRYDAGLFRVRYLAVSNGVS